MPILPINVPTLDSKEAYAQQYPKGFNVAYPAPAAAIATQTYSSSPTGVPAPSPAPSSETENTGTQTLDYMPIIRMHSYLHSSLHVGSLYVKILLHLMKGALDRGQVATVVRRCLQLVLSLERLGWL